jgi:1,4-dihydroxy-2-naphthoyl-CoA hydrolase
VSTTPPPGLPDLDLDLIGANAFGSATGFRLTSVSGTKVTGVLEVGPAQHTPWGVVHGGVYCSVVEGAASVGASLAVAADGRFAVGVNNNTDFIRATTEGTLEVVAEPIQQGRTQQLWQVLITRADDSALVARGQVRLQNVRLPGTPRG